MEQDLTQTDVYMYIRKLSINPYTLTTLLVKKSNSSKHF